jgi:hypothetical protein
MSLHIVEAVEGVGVPSNRNYETQIHPFTTTLCRPNPVPSIWNAFQRYNEKQSMYQIIMCVFVCMRANECCAVAMGGDVEIRFATPSFHSHPFRL